MSFFNFVILFDRACIQLNLPDSIAMQVDCLVHCPQSNDTSVREAMHVQSISHWAPANIGPYSQATKVHKIFFFGGGGGGLGGNVDRGLSFNFLLATPHPLSFSVDASASLCFSQSSYKLLSVFSEFFKTQGKNFTNFFKDKIVDLSTELIR